MLIVTYNILSHHLTEPEKYCHSSESDLNPKNRWDRILKKMDNVVKKSAIVLLQEIPLDWAGSFHQYFASKNYYLVMGHYGKSKNGYMGVGIAVPLAKFTLLDATIQRLSDGFLFEKPSNLDLALRFLKKLPLKLQGKPADKFDHPGLFSKNRMNQFVGLKLTEKSSKKQFFVATYHMPMAFILPQVMSLHTILLFQKSIELAEGLPMVIGGDFNFTPFSPQYKWVITDKLDESHPSYPAGLVKNLSLEKSRTLRSAYSTVSSSEPEWTNYGQNGQKKPFIETLDYLWITSEWKTKSVLPLPKKSEIAKPLPHEVEPSDHLLLGAELVL